MAFHVGQKVVCIDDTNSLPLPIIKGSIYTVAGYAAPDQLKLFEEPGRKRNGDISHSNGWHVSRFRPIVAKPTSISIFTAMLGPKQKETIDG